MAYRKTVRQRIAFVPSERVDLLLRELSALSGNSMSKLAAEMLDEVAPVIRGQLDALKALQSTPEKAREYVQDYANRAVIEIAQTALDFGKDTSTKGAKRRGTP